MKKLILLFLTISSSPWTFAQVCETTHPTNPTSYSNLEHARVAIGFSSCIDVFFHIVRNSNGTNAFTPPNTDAIVRKIKNSMKNLELTKKEAILL